MEDTLRPGYPNPCLAAPPSHCEEDLSEDGGAKKSSFGPGGASGGSKEGRKVGNLLYQEENTCVVVLLTYQGFPPAPQSGIPLLLISSNYYPPG